MIYLLKDAKYTVSFDKLSMNVLDSESSQTNTTACLDLTLNYFISEFDPH